MASTTDPVVLRELDIPDAGTLAGLADLLGELQTVLRCCERAVGEPGGRATDDEDPVLESLWTTAVLSYARCFAENREVRLTEDDVAGLRLEGEVVRWHHMLLRLRDHYADPVRNPRERFSVGVARDERGDVSGVAITSTPYPTLDEVTVRQTGALAYALATLVDQRITDQQERVRAAATALPADSLDALPVVEVDPGGTGSA